MAVEVYPTAALVFRTGSAISADLSTAYPDASTTTLISTNDGDASYIEEQPAAAGGTISWGGTVGVSSGLVAGGNLIGSNSALPSTAHPDQAYVKVVAYAVEGDPVDYVLHIQTSTTTVGYPADTVWAGPTLPTGGYQEIHSPIPGGAPTDIDESGFASLYRIRLYPRAYSYNGQTNHIRVTQLGVVVPTLAAPLRHRNRDDGLANSMARKGPKGPTSSQLSARRGPRAYS